MTYSQEQLTYITANAVYQAASEAHHANRDDKEARQVWHDALEARRVAREELVTWAINKCKDLPQYENYKEVIERIRNHPSPKLKEQVVDLSLRLRP